MEDGVLGLLKEKEALKETSSASFISGLIARNVKYYLILIVLRQNTAISNI